MPVRCNKGRLPWGQWEQSVVFLCLSSLARFCLSSPRSRHHAKSDRLCTDGGEICGLRGGRRNHAAGEGLSDDDGHLEPRSLPQPRMRVNLGEAEMRSLHASCPRTSASGGAKSRGRGRVRVLQHRFGMGKHRRPSSESGGQPPHCKRFATSESNRAEATATTNTGPRS